MLPAPPWSPDWMPIEKMFSKVKGVLRSLAARTTEALLDAMADGLRRVCPKDILGWFKSCGLGGDRDGTARQGPEGLRDPNRYRCGDLCATHS